MIEPAFR